MTKIWEIHYTYRNGNTVNDSVGTQHLTTATELFPVVQEPLPLFSERRGISCPIGQPSGSAYGYSITGSGATNARFYANLYNYRSFVAWIWKLGNADADNTPIWAEGSSIGASAQGFVANAGNLVIRLNNNSRYTTALASNQWHMLTMCVDRFGVNTKAYLNDQLVLDRVEIPSGVYAECYIGARTYTREPNIIVGYTTTFDHFLSETEVKYLYDTFLVDSNDPSNFPYATVSGTIFDVSGNPLNGAEVVAYNLASKEIVAHNTTNSIGQYSLDFPTAGQFSISTSKLGINGGRVVQATVSGGTVEFNPY